MHAWLHREARHAAPGILLAVAQKRIVAQIEAIGPLPRNVEWLHHGAVSGIDSFREVSRIVVVGRQAPSPSAVQACAEALTGAACTRLPARQWYQRIDAVHELTDGRLVATERDGHPDSIAEAFRRRITVLELQQIIGAAARWARLDRSAASRCHATEGCIAERGVWRGQAVRLRSPPFRYCRRSINLPFTAHPASFVIVAVYVVAWLIFDHEVMAPTAICRSK